MSQALWIRTFRDSLSLLAGCCALLFGFVWLRLWIVSQINFAEATNLFTKMLPKFFEQLLPVPFDEIATIEGRIVFGFEELPVALLVALWAVSRGTDCLAGRMGDGTLEMLLAQPVRRMTLFTSHSGVTLLGVGACASAAWLGTAAGILTVDFQETTSATVYLPATVNLFSLGTFMVGAATLVSAVAASRAQAVAIFVGFYVLELTCKLLSLMSTDLEWLNKLTFLSAYEPTQLTIGLQSAPAQTWPLFWQTNGTLTALGACALAVAAAIFCWRDVPAPL